MSDDADTIQNLLASVAVLKSQMSEAGRGLGKLDRILSDLIDEVRKLATKEIEHAYDRKQLDQLVRDLEEFKGQLDALERTFDNFKDAVRDEKEANLQRELEEAKQQVQTVQDTEAKSKQAWMDTARGILGRIIETLIVSLIAIEVYRYIGIKIPGVG